MIGNTYCLLELVLKAILTHNSIIITSDSDYMKATNELILILVKRILNAYNIDKNFIQILYTSRIEELLSNNIGINKVIAIGNRNFQNKIRKISKVEVISKGYNYFDLYIENEKNIAIYTNPDLIFLKDEPREWFKQIINNDKTENIPQKFIDYLVKKDVIETL